MKFFPFFTLHIFSFWTFLSPNQHCKYKRRAGRCVPHNNSRAPFFLLFISRLKRFEFVNFFHLCSNKTSQSFVAIIKLFWLLIYFWELQECSIKIWASLKILEKAERNFFHHLADLLKWLHRQRWILSTCSVCVQ